MLGADVDLKVDRDVGLITGRIGGAVIGKTVNVKFDSDRLRGRLGGTAIGWDVFLYGTERITGRWGGPVIGFDCNLVVSQGFLVGRLGGAIVGRSVDMTLSKDFPPVVSALIAAMTCQYFRSTR